MRAANETRFGTSGWLYSANRDQVLGIADVNNDGREDIVIQSGTHIAVLNLSGSAIATQFVSANGATFGSWTSFDSKSHGTRIFGSIG